MCLCVCVCVHVGDRSLCGGVVCFHVSAVGLARLKVKNFFT